ncbi:MAG: non-heme iron oxygenase ferredoxin subunit [Gemmatimonadota bacterium]|nr:MAG: non-heme iron oxygenase ferredoxin subunit [Gemmatimonadota bacterium]
MDADLQRVSRVDELDEGVPFGVELKNGEQICLVKVDREIFAISNICSHAEFPLSDGEMVDDYVIECGLHGAQFDIRDGGVIELPATEPLCCYEVRVEDGEVWVRSNTV